MSPPPPHDSTPSSSAASIIPEIPNSRYDTCLKIRIHPVVVANIFNHHARVKRDQAACSSSPSSAAAAQPPRIFVCVLGRQRHDKVEILNSFELAVDPVSGALDYAFFEKQQDLYHKLFPEVYVKGWYSIANHVQVTDMKIHRQFLYVDDNPVYLLFNPAINTSRMDLHATIYESDLYFIDRRAQLIFVRPRHKIEIVKKAWPTEVQAFKHPHVGETTSNVIATIPHEEGEDANSKLWPFRRMPLETPSGFAMFGIDDKVFSHPEDIWACFTCLSDAKSVTFTIGFIKVDNKSIALDHDAGPGEELGHFILKFCNKKGLIVQNLQLKLLIETKLDVPCWFNEHIVPELTWGLNFVLDEFVPEEKGNLTNKYYLPLSNKLEKKIKDYGFNVSKQMIDREFISMVGRLKYLEYTSGAIFKFLHDRFDHCFPGTGMSETLYAEAIENLISCEPSVVTHDDKYCKEDILGAIDYLLAIPKHLKHAQSRLRRMEAAAHLQEALILGMVLWVL